LKIDALLSTSHINDLESWKLCHEKNLENIDANRYIVVVPDKQFHIFRKSTSRIYECVSESDFFPEFSKSDLSLLLSPIHKKKAGWYYQQFLKLKSFDYFDSKSTILFLEGDSFLTKNFKFFEGTSLLMIKSTEHHQPYFTTNKNLLGFDKQVNFSFISQALPVKAMWGKNLLRDIELKFKTKWYLAIVKSLDSSHSIAFSEYELMGNYFDFQKYDYKSSDQPFYRNGGLFFKSLLASDQKYYELIQKNSIIAIEKADTSSLYIKLKRKLQRYIYD
jgi:hypothetical protein